MKLVVAYSIEKRAKELWLDFNDLYNFIKQNWTHNFIKLCAPIDGTSAYKAYIDSLKRIVVFHINQTWVIYPVYIWDKHDKIVQNITVDIVRKSAKMRHQKVESDFKNRKIKIRHF